MPGEESEGRNRKGWLVKRKGDKSREETQSEESRKMADNEGEGRAREVGGEKWRGQDENNSSLIVIKGRMWREVAFER